MQVHQQEECYFVNLQEVAMVVLEDQMTLLTGRLLIELAQAGIGVLVLGTNHLPVGEYLPLFNHSRTAKKFKAQIAWSKTVKAYVWTKIVEHKLTNQIHTLYKLEKPEKLETLHKLRNTISVGDKNNREGVAARVYFKGLFGENFIRFSADLVNSCLNFTYHIVRTVISKVIIARGYTTVLGINHTSEYNHQNFSDDLIEVYRPIVDYYVYKILEERLEDEKAEINKELKVRLLDVLNEKIEIVGMKYSILNSVEVYLGQVVGRLEAEEMEDFEFPMLCD